MQFSQNIEVILIIALATSTITETVCRSILFKPIRKWLNFKLLYCPYCFAHWVAFSFMIFNCNNVFDFIINSFAIVTLAVPGMLLIEYLFNVLEKK